MTSVLIVEDDALTRRAVMRRLKGAGYHVVGADSVQFALHVAQSVTLDAVVSDFDLPDGTAIELYAALDCPKHFAVHTGNATASIGGLGPRFLSVPCFTKPNVDGVLAQLQEWFPAQ